MRYDEEFNSPVIKNWDDMKECMFAEKRWVDPKNVNIEKEYEKGDFLRVYCAHDGGWCQCEAEDLEFCPIYSDHNNE